MESLWAAGKLPVVVGGTGYYVEGILFKDSLISTNTTGADLDQYFYILSCFLDQCG